MRCLHRALNLWYQSYLCFRLQPDIKAINTNRNLSKYKSIMSRLQLILSYFQRTHLLSSNVGVAQKDHCWKPWQNSFSAVSYGRRACSYRVSGGSICLPVFFDLTTVAILEGVSYSICVSVYPPPLRPNAKSVWRRNFLWSRLLCCLLKYLQRSSFVCVCMRGKYVNNSHTVSLDLWTFHTVTVTGVEMCLCLFTVLHRGVNITQVSNASWNSHSCGVGAYLFDFLFFLVCWVKCRREQRGQMWWGSVHDKWTSLAESYGNGK